jgi:phage-related protein
MDGIMLPRRQVTCNQCTALYRSADCTFTGDYVVADETDTPMSGTNTGEWNAATTYSAGQVCWRFIKNRRVYFQALVSGLVGEGTKPYRIGLWKTERCSLRLTGCKMRFGINAELPINSFPATRKGAA